MKTGKGRRGRPKGTGINDTVLLYKIAVIVVDNPDIKRTTAIKQIGIENPSIVRRLRDKFAADADKYIGQVHSSRAAAAAQPASKSRKRAAKATPIAVTATAAPAAAKPATARKPAAAPAAEQPINIEALVTRVLGQALGIPSEAFSNTPIFALLREQMRLVDQVLPLLRTQIQTAAKIVQAA